MGQTSKPLWLVVEDALMQTAPIAALKDQGHRVQPLSCTTTGDLEKADMILSPRAWRMFPETVKYLPLAIKSARLEVYGKTGKKTT